MYYPPEVGNTNEFTVLLRWAGVNRRTLFVGNDLQPGVPEKPVVWVYTCQDLMAIKCWSRW